MAFIVLLPELSKITPHPPVPPERVMVQLWSAPVMSTVPVGIVGVPLTVTSTSTTCPGTDGSGESAVMVVVESVAAGTTS